MIDISICIYTYTYIYVYIMESLSTSATSLYACHIPIFRDFLCLKCSQWSTQDRCVATKWPGIVWERRQLQRLCRTLMKATSQSSITSHHICTEELPVAARSGQRINILRGAVSCSAAWGPGYSATTWFYYILLQDSQCNSFSLIP